MCFCLICVCVLKQDCRNKQTLRQLQPSSTDLSCIRAIYKRSHAWLSFCLYFLSYFSPPLSYALPIYFSLSLHVLRIPFCCPPFSKETSLSYTSPVFSHAHIPHSFPFSVSLLEIPILVKGTLRPQQIFVGLLSDKQILSGATLVLKATTDDAHSQHHNFNMKLNYIYYSSTTVYGENSNSYYSKNMIKNLVKNKPIGTYGFYSTLSFH